MKTEELLRYDAEYRAMREAFGTYLLVFDYQKQYPCVKSEGKHLSRNGEVISYTARDDQIAPLP